MAREDEPNYTQQRGAGGHERTTALDDAIAEILQEARRALERDATPLAETPAMCDAVARAATAAESAGLGADTLFAALDRAVTALGHEYIPNDGERIRAAVAALLLRARVSGPTQRDERA